MSTEPQPHVASMTPVERIFIGLIAAVRSYDARRPENAKARTDRLIKAAQELAPQLMKFAPPEAEEWVKQVRAETEAGGK